MSDTQKRVRVAVSFGEGGTAYGCGHALDTFLFAYGLTTEDSLWEWNIDAEHDAINHVLTGYDWEAYTLERLNALETPSPSEEYLYGDWMRFEQPGAFIEASKKYKEIITGYVWGELGDWSSGDIPADLRKQLLEAYNWVTDQAHHEWLHGDRLNEGVLSQLAKSIFGRYTSASVDWETKTDVVTIEADADEWREWYGYELGDDEPLPESETIAQLIRKDTLRRAEALRIKAKQRSEERAEDYKRREAIKAEELEREKAAARERKLKKDQAS